MPSAERLAAKQPRPTSLPASISTRSRSRAGPPTKISPGARRHEGVSVRGEGDGQDRVLLGVRPGFPPEQFFAGGQVLEPGRAVAAARGEGLAIGSEGERPHPALMAGDAPKYLAGRGVPQLDSSRRRRPSPGASRRCEGYGPGPPFDLLDGPHLPPVAAFRRVNHPASPRRSVAWNSGPVPAARALPSGAKASADPRGAEGGDLRPVAASQMRTTRSPPAEASRALPGAKATAAMSPSLWRNRTVPSRATVARWQGIAVAVGGDRRRFGRRTSRRRRLSRCLLPLQDPGVDDHRLEGGHAQAGREAECEPERRCLLQCVQEHRRRDLPGECGRRGRGDRTPGRSLPESRI